MHFSPVHGLCRTPLLHHGGLPTDLGRSPGGFEPQLSCGFGWVSLERNGIPRGEKWRLGLAHFTDESSEAQSAGAGGACSSGARPPTQACWSPKAIRLSAFGWKNSVPELPCHPAVCVLL